MTANQSSPHVPRRMARLILSGFAILIGLMAVLVANSVLNMRAQAARVAAIVVQHERKIQYASDLLKATHNRHNSLVYQVLVDDPFEQDDHFQQYIKWGYEVGKARNALRAMDLDEFEQAQLDKQDRLVAHIVDLHERISDLARQGRFGEARHLIAGDLRPYNLDFIASVGELETYERTRIERTIEDARTASWHAIAVDLALGLLLILLACLIAYLTYRQTRLHVDTISAQMQALEETGVQLRHEATHDPLTGLANRNLFYSRLAEALTHARQDGLEATVLYIDLDDFKPINDQYGHTVGDDLLKAVAARLLKSVRATDTVARLGGDEFGVILLGVGDAGRITEIDNEIKRKVGEPLQVGDLTLRPSCSCGHAVYPRDGSGMDTLLHAADVRMYAVKRQRKPG